MTIVERLPIDQQVIAWANNSLYGSLGYFLTTKDGFVVGAVGVDEEPDPHHLAKQIEKIKAASNRDYNDARKAADLLDEAVRALEESGAELCNTFCRNREHIPGCKRTTDLLSRIRAEQSKGETSP